MAAPALTSNKIARLTLYRRVLHGWAAEGRAFVFSHQLAEASRTSSAQVRRDLMMVGYSGNPYRGYAVDGLATAIAERLGDPAVQRAILLGVGQLGRAVLGHLSACRPPIAVEAAFDVDPEKTGRMILGCRCLSVAELETFIRERAVTLAILAVPAAAAQPLADRLVAAGVKGLVNYTPTPLRLPPHFPVVSFDLRLAVEQLAVLSHERSDHAP